GRGALADPAGRAVDPDDRERGEQDVAGTCLPDLAQELEHLRRRGAVVTGEPGTVDDPGMDAEMRDLMPDHSGAGGDAAAAAEAGAKLLCQQFGEQVVRAEVHEIDEGPASVSERRRVCAH